MSHKNITPENPTCSSCATFLPYLSFVMQDFYLYVTKTNPDIHICQGYRTENDQHNDFLSGKSKLDWPNSAHNNLKEGLPFSEAVDLFVLDSEGKAQFPISRYQDLYDAAILSNQQINWGGLWQTFKDYDHFQNSGWHSPLSESSGS
jgi:hypothetical protein